MFRASKLRQRHNIRAKPIEPRLGIGDRFDRYGTAWDYVYTDSHNDAPMLAAGKRGFIVNAQSIVVAKLKAGSLSEISQLHWS